MISASRPSRTLVASVLFVDLVEFSRMSVSEQIEIKAALTRILRRILSSIPEDDYRLMDTGDGAALGFVADPEHALYFALAIDAACREAGPSSRLGSGALRIGINLGPVKDVFDVNDRPSLIGDGINTAQRVVGFAQPGQITISRSFFELVSRLAPEYSGIFVHIGAHDDKHGREHDLYVIRPAKDMLRKIQERLQLIVAEATGINVVFSEIIHALDPPEAEPGQGAIPVTDAARKSPEDTVGQTSSSGSASAWSSLRRRPLAIGLLAVLMVGGAIAVASLLMQKPPESASAPPRPPAAAPVAASPGDGAAAVTAPATDVTRPPPRPSGDGPVAPVPASTPARSPAKQPLPAAAAPAVTAAEDRNGVESKAAPSTKAVNPASRGTYTRCSTLMQKTTLGETLTQTERREMAEFCR